MTRAQLTIRVGLPLLCIAVLVFLLWRPLKIQYYLHTYRLAPDALQVYSPPICELGAPARAAVINAIYAYAEDDEGGHLRVAAFHTLRCLRQREADARVGSTPGAGVVSADLEPDEEALDAMVHAYEHEPNALYRDEMQRFLTELDFRTRFRLWARLAGAADDLRGPYFRPQGPRFSPADHETPAMRDAWCADLAPILRRWVGPSADETLRNSHRAQASTLLLTEDCRGEDLPLAVGYLHIARLDKASTRFALSETLRVAREDVGRQSAIIEALTGANVECERSHMFLDALSRQSFLEGQALEALERWTHSIDEPCLRSWFPAESVEESRRQMSRTLRLADEGEDTPGSASLLK